MAMYGNLGVKPFSRDIQMKYLSIRNGEEWCFGPNMVEVLPTYGTFEEHIPGTPLTSEVFFQTSP